MKALSTKRINKIAPCHVTQRDNGDFLFTTAKGINYNIGFCPDMQIAGNSTYQFFINRLSTQHQGYEAEVKDTIIAIILEFFDTNNEIMLYICDTSDGRESARNRLFINWFKEQDKENRFIIKTAKAKVEDEEFYTAIILQNNHPDRNSIIEEFDYLSANLSNK